MPRDRDKPRRPPIPIPGRRPRPRPDKNKPAPETRDPRPLKPPGDNVVVKPPDPTVIDVPIPIHGEDHTRDFAALRSTHPLLLLPVRLETRFDGRSLKVRIYPDQIHLDEHQTKLSSDEVTYGKSYWEQHDAAATDEAKDAAIDWLVALMPARRAAWVAKKTEPERGSDGALTFPSVATTTAAEQGRAALLPIRWAIAGFIDGEQRFVQFGKEIPSEVAFSPLLGEGEPYSTRADALPVDEGFAWMIDYTEAVNKGLGVTITLSESDYQDAKAHGLTLFAVGVRGGTPSQGAESLNDLLRAHLYTDGLSFLPQGTPTNNTDEASSGWTEDVSDVYAFFARTLDGEGLAEGRDMDAVRLNKALGLGDRDLLSRAEGGRTTDEASSRAMNRVLWPATWGGYLRDMMAPLDGAPLAGEDARASLREWFVANVRGGAPLPVIAVGPQPYGILPVRLDPVHVDPSDAIDHLERVLLSLLDRWRESLDSVPRIDPVDGDDIAAHPEDDVVTILGTLPHPGRFVVRRLYYQRELRLFFWEWIWLVIDDTTAPLHPIAGRYHAREGDILNIDDQIDVLHDILDDLDDLFPTSQDDRDDATVVVEAMITMAEAHRDRQDPVQTLFPDAVSGVFDEDVKGDPKLFWSDYGDAEDDRLFTRPLVEAEDAGLGETADAYLNALQGRIGGGAAIKGARAAPRANKRSRVAVAGVTAPIQPITGVAGPVTVKLDQEGLALGFHDDEPLLYQLLAKVIDDLPAAEKQRYRMALGVLEERSRDELTLRLRETLGLASHRIDAWLTSFARARLDEMRGDDAHPKGVQIGGFGWVEDLKPDARGTQESQGFIPTMSQGHAVTAAVLRAGYKAHGTGASSATAAVNLSSEKVRFASWMLDGVRQGQAVGDLLGCRFERRLHDEGLDAFIDDCRRRVLESQGKTRDPRGPVDGLALAELYQSTGVGVGDAGTVLKPSVEPGKAKYKKVKAALDSILGDIDTVNDASLADAVHHLLAGNRGRATATLDSIATGEVPPPELRSLVTPSAGPGVLHRLLITLGEPQTTLWGSGPRSRLEPSLDGWVSLLLGDPGAAVCAVSFTALDDATPVPSPRVVTMKELKDRQGLSALDAALEPLARWSRRVASLVLADVPDYEGKLTVDLDATGLVGASQVSFRELSLLARAAQGLLARSRPLDARDLALPSDTAEPGWDLAELTARVQTAIDGFAKAYSNGVDGLVEVLPAATAEEPHPVGDKALSVVRGAMMAFAGYGVAGAVPVIGFMEASRASLYEAAWALADKVKGRIDAIAAIDASAAPASDEERLRRERSRLALVLGRDFPLCPRVTPADAAEVTAAFAASDALLGGDPVSALDWLQRLGKVREGTARLSEVIAASELIRDGLDISPKVAQRPFVEGEGWVANAAPLDPSQGKLALFAVDRGGLDALAAGKALHGLVADSWTERLPASEQVTGTALHFDAPSSRAPQAWLLMVPKKREAWSFDLVMDMLAQTFERMKLRAVDPDVLLGHGHQFPAIFPRGALDAGAQPEGDA